MCEKSLYSLDEIIDNFKEVTEDHLCSDTEWAFLTLGKSAFTKKKIEELEGKKWFQVLME